MIERVYFVCGSKDHVVALYPVMQEFPRAGILVSYFYLATRGSLLPILPHQRVFLDSGAYSVKSRGGEIDIDRYAEFIMMHRSQFEIVVSLDVIGDPLQTARNHAYFKARGIRSMTTFHGGEPNDALQAILDGGEERLGIGGVARSAAQNKAAMMRFLERSWRTIEAHGRPVKVHAFGANTPDVVCTFPWTTIDSTTWVDFSRYGMGPEYAGKTRFVYDAQGFFRVTGLPRKRRYTMQEHQRLLAAGARQIMRLVEHHHPTKEPVACT